MTHFSVKITHDGIKTDTQKTKAITSTFPPLPKKCKLVATFLGMVERFSKFIPHFSELCEP